MNVNKVIIVGRLAQDPEVRTTPSGQQVANFSVATSRVWNDRQSGNKQEQTEFHRVVAWGKTAEIAGQYLKKGQLVSIEGRLQTRSWEGKDGGKRYTTEIVIENMQMGPKASGAGGGSYSGGSNPSTSSRPSQSNASPVEDDDIPVVDQDSPTSGVKDEGPSSGVDESEVDLKDIPF